MCLQVKDGKSFLDLIAEQVLHMRQHYGSNVTFILMNSFSTSDDTKAFLRKAHADLVNVSDMGAVGQMEDGFRACACAGLCSKVHSIGFPSCV